jgi:hypothetical protein
VASMRGRGNARGDAFSLCFPHSPMPSPASGMLPRFRLSIAPAPVATELPVRTAPPLEMCLDLGIGCQARGSQEGDTHPPDSADTPATSRRVGSFTHDQESRIYTLQWEDLSAFHAWRREEELTHSIELIASSTVSGGRLWLQKRVYVCARQLSGGPNKYKKKFSHRFRKIGTKKTGCRCRIVIKRYHHTPTVLGRYVSGHDHDIGVGNIAYMRLSRTARETVKTMLIQQIDRRAIVRNRP